MRRHWTTWLFAALALAVLTACGSAGAGETEEGAVADYESRVLTTGYEGALDVGAQLALGSLRLEETEHAVTPEQAETLIPLWQALQGGVTAEDEVRAVLRGIEEAMTEEQLATIAGMELTDEDMEAWVEERGVGPPGDFSGMQEDPAARSTRQALGGGEGVGQVPSGGDVPPVMSTRRAELEGMSQEERKAMRATAQAGGGPGGGFRGGAGSGPAPSDGGSFRLLLRPLIALLEARSTG